MKITNWNKLDKDYWVNTANPPGLRIWIEKNGRSYEVHAGELKGFAPCLHLDTHITKKSDANEIAIKYMKNHI